jgi:hypothetical protein
MHRDELLAEITRAFPAAPHPGEAALLPAGTEASEAARSIQAGLGNWAWPDVPDDFLRAQLPVLASLNPMGFRFYLPAFLGFALREPAAQRIEPLLALLKLPAELSGPAVAELLSYVEAASPLPAAAIGSLMQQQLRQTNQALHHFIARVSQLTPLQAKAIYHFMSYLRDTGSTGPTHQQEAAVAIERYWFQFA